ncbi:response regulator transcription factor [Microbacterium album]|uniref:Helix-turn-helix transcriptional regulator n=1 Tax=Microbacterium album TaxID=2053191 RepID=A0A917IE76_9MICO|nr:LuxR C-terminal-related transcriptional regulator [Microbacterium album]GGH43951.1 helix-turn-helix transcriptional regulator [Microbacterium album]
MTLQEQRADDRRLVADAVRELARQTRFPVAFGGLFEDGAARMTAFLGNHTNALEGLAVKIERGLGGRAMQELRPRMTGDYRSARQITHDYDRYILGEGIGTLLAAPIIVEGQPRGVLYGGTWGPWGVGDVSAAPAMRVADAVATELRVRAEVDRRVAALRDVTPHDTHSVSRAPEPLSASQREELRESYAELRRITADVADADIRGRLEELERKLASLSGLPEASAAVKKSDVKLSPREIDVLARVALGETNAEIGALLGLREATVKAYLSSAMAKLGASTRHAAVARSRKWGLLP